MTLISGGRYYRKLTVLLYGLPESTASVALRHLGKWAVFPFNLSSYNHIYIAKYLLIDTKIWETPKSWHAKCSLPVAIRVVKTRVLKPPNLQAPCSLKRSIFVPKKPGEK